MGTRQTANDSSCDGHAFRLRLSNPSRGIGALFNSDAHDIEIRGPNLTNADVATGGRGVEDPAVAGIDSVVTRHDDEVAWPGVGEANRSTHRRLRTGAVGKIDTELGVHKLDESRAIEAGGRGTTEAVGNSDVLLRNLEYLVEAEVGVGRVFEIVRCGRTVILGEDNLICGIATDLRKARGVECCVIDGERRFTRDYDVLRLLGGVDDFGAEGVRRERDSSHECGNEGKDRDTASVFADQCSTSTTSGWPDAANHLGDEPNGVTDSEGRGVTNSKESITQEFSPVPEALHLPVIHCGEPHTDGEIGPCAAVLCAR